MVVSWEGSWVFSRLRYQDAKVARNKIPNNKEIKLTFPKRLYYDSKSIITKLYHLQSWGVQEKELRVVVKDEDIELTSLIHLDASNGRISTFLGKIIQNY